MRQGKIFAAKPRSAPTSARKPGSAGLGDMAQKSASAHRHLAMSARASDDRDTAHKDAQKSARRTADGQSQQPQSCSHAEQQHAASPVNTEPAGSYAASPSLSPEAPEHSLLDRLQVQLTKLNDDIQSARADVSSVEHAPVRHHRPRGHLHSTVGVKSSSRVDVSTEAPEPKPEPARPTLDSVVKALQGQVAQLTAQVAAQLRDKESAATPKSARATEDLARQLAEKSVSVELLSQKLAAASVDSLKLREAADRLTSENEELRLAAKKYKRQMAEFRESWNALDKWADGLQAENDAKEAQVAKLTAELEELKGGQSRDKSALHTRLKQELALCDKLKAQIEELKAKGAEQEAQVRRVGCRRRGRQAGGR